ncbi:uncharacterized protein M6B38_328550 [Iris pallida]|uniref:RRM domain-containing protein n=1 Tax=Iris pallida TaxID=29817 RepID=A0AAX6H5H2_IRIPA|nr:uncharacterized protein M6B38_328550 [Iris pallida]
MKGGGSDGGGGMEASAASAAGAVAGEGDESPAMTRIYIGGVSAGVTEPDIEKTFSSLGRVAGVELVRTSGRSFAYMDFHPSSQKSLAKLFSTYNGCTWKGGKLKLEKAKEHYLSRLKREWDEDIKLMSVTPVDPKVEPDAAKLKSERSKLEDTHLRIFFPKLRKVKSLPFKGSGKHKYSFQRVEVPSHPIHFCDCEEHSKQSEADSQKYFSALSSGIYYEKELSVMESVMNKLFEKENNETGADRETELTTDEEVSEPSVDDISLEETDTASDMDEDNIVTNIGKGRRGDKLMQLTRADNQKSVLGKTQPSKDGSAQNKANSKKRQKTGLSDTSEVTANSKKHPVEQDEDEFSAILPRNTSRKGHPQEPETFAEPPPDKSRTDLGTSETQSTKGPSWLQKSAWRELVGQAGSSSFSISHVVPDISSVLPMQPNKLGIDTVVSSRKATETQSDGEKSKPFQVKEHTLSEQAVSLDLTEVSEAGDEVEATQIGDVQNEDEFSAILPRNTSRKGHPQEPETFAEPPPDKSRTDLGTSETQSTKGPSWLQKSAWRELVGQAGSSSFSISHVVPDISSVLPMQPNKSGIDTVVSSKKATETQSDREKSKPFQVKEHTLSEQAVSLDLTEVPEAGDEVEATQVGDGQKEPPQRTSNQDPRRATPKVVISDTCTFMRSAESEKEWAKARTALSGYLRKKKKREEKDGPKSFHHMPSRRN